MSSHDSFARFGRAIPSPRGRVLGPDDSALTLRLLVPRLERELREKECVKLEITLNVRDFGIPRGGCVAVLSGLAAGAWFSSLSVVLFMKAGEPGYPLSLARVPGGPELMSWPLSITGPMGLLTVGLAPKLCFFLDHELDRVCAQPARGTEMLPIFAGPL